ncbi:MAG: DUF115 domain-containing protein [Spirochaetaceae bacterium]|jgi:hypothetical protein|nr:DUF115 domain-containing protein [Spirochaetaceae bacterium]
MTSEMPRVVPAKRGYTVFYEGRPLLSTIDPVAAADRLIAALPKDERTLYLCVSPLLGYGIPRLLDTMHPSSAVLCVEAETALAVLAREQLPPEITRHSRFMLLAGPPPGTSPAAALAVTLDTWGPRAFRRVVRFNPSAAVLRASLYRAIEETLRREITLAWENAATLMKLGRRYALNFLRNLRLLDIAPSVETCFRLEGIPRNAPGDTPGNVQSPEQTAGRFAPHGNTAPVHVLGAGPSLDRFFTDYRGGGIVCVDTALPALRARGFRADLAVALEAQHWNLRDFAGCGDTAAALAMDMSALPATFNSVNGKVCLFFTPWTPLRIFDRLKNAALLPLEMPPLGNVGITAYALARRLFPAGKIIPHGLDFAFTIDQYHCRDSPAHINRLRNIDRFHSPLPAAAALRPASFAAVNEQGEPVRQDPVMRRYQELFLSVRSSPNITAAAPQANKRQKTAATFITETRAELTRIRRILSGEEKVPGAYLQTLLDRNDFLFAHYPDYAATNNRANIEDLSFLKRIRAEIEAFIKAVSVN